MPPTILTVITIIQIPTNLERCLLRLFHASVFRTTICSKHSHFLEVKVLISHHRINYRCETQKLWSNQFEYAPLGRIAKSEHTSDYERSNRNKFNIRYWSWNYRGCWHQTCPPIDTCQAVYIELIPITRHNVLHWYFSSLPPFSKIG